jgi:hypothetical protein
MATLSIWKSVKRVRGMTEALGTVSRIATLVVSTAGTGLAAAKRPRKRTGKEEEKNLMLEMGWWWRI